MRIHPVWLLAIALLTAVSSASACSCMVSSECALPTADAVFVGRVVSKDMGDGRYAYGTPTSLRRVTIHFAVVEPISGVKTSEVEVGTTEGCCACGIEFTIGATYLVFANEYQGRLTTGMCTATQPAATAAALIEQLRARARGDATASLFGVVALGTGPQYRFDPPFSEPLAGIQVKAVGANGQYSTTSDGHGIYQFRDLPPDSYLVKPAFPPQISSSDLTRTDLPPIKIAGGSSCGYNISAKWDGRISGRVVDKQGRPVQGFVALDYVEPKKFSNGAVQNGVGGFTTQSDGRFEFALVAPDRYRLIFSPGVCSAGDTRTQVAYPEIITLGQGQHLDGLVVTVP